MDVEQIRRDFPILDQKVYGVPLVYLDNAASTQIPVQVLERVRRHYTEEHANIYRGNHALSQRSSIGVEKAREHIAHYIGAERPESIVFTSGTTASIHLAAQAFVRQRLRPGDSIIVTEMEHHSNFIVWQQLCRETGAQLKIVPVVNGDLDMLIYQAMLNENVGLVAVCAVSNVLGTVNPVEKIAALAHEKGVPVLVDAAQGMRHNVWDMVASGFDFFCFSGHKVMSVTGTGVLYVNPKWFSQITPPVYGGGMVDRVGRERTTFADMPHILEAGTPNISGILALSEAVHYLERLGPDLYAREDALTARLEKLVGSISRVRILGQPAKRAGVVSVTVDGVAPSDLAALLDKQGVAVRAGTQCAQVLLGRLGVSSVLRFSPAFYNTFQELDAAAAGLEAAIRRLERWQV